MIGQHRNTMSNQTQTVDGTVPDEPTLAEIADALVHNKDFQDDVVNCGLHEALVEGGHGYAIGNETAQDFIAVLMEDMNGTLQELADS